MCPRSTLQVGLHVQEEDMKKLLKLKTELARFLQQTVGELAKDVKRNSSGEVAAEARALSRFLKDVRGGRSVSNTDIVRFARLFSDELTLENLDRVHLVTLCQVRRRCRCRRCCSWLAGTITPDAHWCRRRTYQPYP